MSQPYDPSVPTIVVGDLNCILLSQDKWGKRPVTELDTKILEKLMEGWDLIEP